MNYVPPSPKKISYLTIDDLDDDELQNWQNNFLTVNKVINI